MENENGDEVVEPVVADTTAEVYIKEIQDLKQNTVSKEAYNNLLKERNSLVEALADGQVIEKVVEEKKVDVGQLVDKLNSGKLNNLEYVETALEIRNEIIRQGGADPFLPNGRNATITNADRETAERVANSLQEMVDYADGNSQIFTDEYQRRVNDVSIIRRK